MHLLIRNMNYIAYQTILSYRCPRFQFLIATELLTRGLGMLYVDVDTGGTMTDTLVSGSGHPLVVKVETSPSRYNRLVY